MDAFAAAGAAAGRARLTDTLAEYERLRHDCRLALMLLAAAEGMNKSAIARAWGISHSGPGTRWRRHVGCGRVGEARAVAVTTLPSAVVDCMTTPGG